jgi:hypothetical protein
VFFLAWSFHRTVLFRSAAFDQRLLLGARERPARPAFFATRREHLGDPYHREVHGVTICTRRCDDLGEITMAYLLSLKSRPP